MDAGRGRRFGNRVTGIFSALLLAGLLAAGAEASGKKGDSAEALQERIAAAVSGIERISCRFVQERRTVLLEYPAVSSGRFHYRAPDCLRWEATQPETYGFSVCGSRARRWRGDAARAQEVSLDREPGLKQFTDQVLAWIRADFRWLEERFRISAAGDDPVTLRLTPFSAEGPGGIRSMRISFSPELTHVETVEIEETDGDFTRIRFSEAVINGPAGKDLFR